MPIVTGAQILAADVLALRPVVAETEVYNAASPTAWTDLDLSGTIGAQLSIVMIKVSHNNNSVESVAFRKNGDTDEFYSTQTPDYCAGSVSLAAIDGIGFGGIHNVFLVATDASGVIEWRTEAARAFTIDIIAYWPAS